MPAAVFKMCRVGNHMTADVFKERRADNQGGKPFFKERRAGYHMAAAFAGERPAYNRGGTSRPERQGGRAEGDRTGPGPLAA